MLYILTKRAKALLNSPVRGVLEEARMITKAKMKHPAFQAYKKELEKDFLKKAKKTRQRKQHKITAL